MLTGYAYPLGWLNGGGNQPFRKLIEGSEKIFSQFVEQAPLPYIPVITAGLNSRPWNRGSIRPRKCRSGIPTARRSWSKNSSGLGVRWLDEHPDKTTPQRLMLIYAWNENGEGGYSTRPKRMTPNISRRCNGR